MRTLEQVWKDNDYQKGLRVRFVDWDFKNKFFSIQNYSTCGKKIAGTLDSGEKISFALDSKFWEAYEEGREENAKAI